MPSSPSSASFGISSIGKVLRLVPFADVRPDLGFGELADAAAQQGLVVGRPEIHDCRETIIRPGT